MTSEEKTENKVNVLEMTVFKLLLRQNWELFLPILPRVCQIKTHECYRDDCTVSGVQYGYLIYKRVFLSVGH